MKKILALVALASLFSLGTISAEDDGFIRSDLDITLGYANDYTNPLAGFSSYTPSLMSDILYGLRLNIGLDLQVKLGDTFALGIESGATIIKISDFLTSGTSFFALLIPSNTMDSSDYTMLDVPLLAKVSIVLDNIEFQAFGGMLYSIDIQGHRSTITKYQVGAKIYLGAFELTGAYVIHDAQLSSIIEQTGYWRFGLGFRIRLAK